MTARTLRLYRSLTTAVDHLRPSREWYETFTPTTVAALLDEIDRLRVAVGEMPSYMSTGTLQEAFEEIIGDSARVRPAGVTPGLLPTESEAS